MYNSGRLGKTVFKWVVSSGILEPSYILTDTTLNYYIECNV